MGNYSAPASSGGGSLTGIDDQSSSNDDQLTIKDTEIVVNEDSDDVDFRVESNGNANMLVVDAANDKVGVGTNAPKGELHVQTTGTDSGLISSNAVADVNGILIESTATNNTNSAPVIALQRNGSDAGADGDMLANIVFIGDNDNNEHVIYGQWKTFVTKADNGGESGSITIQGLVGGTNRAFINMLGAVDDAGESNDFGGLLGPEVAINQHGIDMDFRVESNGNAQMLFVDGGSDAVGIGTSTPSTNVALDVEGAIGLDEISTPTATADRGAIYTKTDNNFFFQDGAGTETVMLKGGKHSIWVPAEAISPRSNAGCAQLATTAAATVGRPDIRSLAFDKSSDEHAQFTIAMPKMWNEGTITAQFYWTSATSNLGQTCAWGFQGVSLSDNDLINTAFGTAVVTSDTQSGTAKDVHISGESSAITIAGSPAAGDLTCFQVFRDTSADNLNEDALLLGIKIFYTIDDGNDA